MFYSLIERYSQIGEGQLLNSTEAYPV